MKNIPKFLITLKRNTRSCRFLSHVLFRSRHNEFKKNYIKPGQLCDVTHPCKTTQLGLPNVQASALKHLLGLLAHSTC